MSPLSYLILRQNIRLTSDSDLFCTLRTESILDALGTYMYSCSLILRPDRQSLGKRSILLLLSKWAAPSTDVQVCLSVYYNGREPPSIYRDLSY